MVLVGNCIGSLSALHYGARHPEAVSALVLLHTLTSELHRAGFERVGLGRLLDLSSSPTLGPLFRWYLGHMPRRHQERFVYVRGQFGPVGEATGQDYLEHTRRCFADPSTRLTYFDLGRDEASWVLPAPGRLAGGPPICWVWGDANRLLPLEEARRQLQVLQPEDVHILKGCGYAAAWEAPEQVNQIIERFLDCYGTDRHGTANAPLGTRQ